MSSKLNRLYLFQNQKGSLEEAVQELEEELAETERDIVKIIHQHHLPFC